MTTPEPPTCPESWPTGIKHGLDVACERAAKHRGWHTNADHDLKWSGRLTADERAQRDEVRAAWSAATTPATPDPRLKD